MMKKTCLKTYILISLAALFSLIGCRSGKPVVQQYYLLELPPVLLTDWPADISAVPAILRIEKVGVSPAYAGHQIAIRENTNQIRYFTFNTWAVRPQEAFTQMSFAFFEKYGLFEHVKLGRTHLPASYLLETEIHHLEIDNMEGHFRARLHVAFSLSYYENGYEIIYQHSADRFQSLELNSINDFTAAVSAMFSEELQTFSIGFINMLGENR